MKNKKILFAAMMVVLIGVVGVGATLAYFTDHDAAQNVLTLGHVDIELDEPNYRGDEEYEDIVPGDVIEKDPTVTLDEDSEDAYLRMRVEIDIKKLVFAENGNEVAGEIDLDPQAEEAAIRDIMTGAAGTLGLMAQAEANNWFYNEEDGYFYFNEKLTRENNQAVLFTRVEIPKSWGNDMAETVIRLDVYAEAIQADNFEPIIELVDVNGTEKEMIVGWAFVDGTPITGEYIEAYVKETND